jgi:hypothetical protein
MFAKQARRRLRSPLGSDNAGQQCVDDERVGNDAADKAAP